jgi:hemerythrin
MTVSLTDKRLVNSFHNNRQVLTTSLNNWYKIVLKGIPKGIQPYDPLRKIIASAIYTFTIEEFWMKRLDYPHLASHIKWHCKIKRKIMTVHDAYHSNTTERASRIFSHVMSIYGRHKQTEDIKFVAYALSRDGVKSSFSKVKEDCSHLPAAF